MSMMKMPPPPTGMRYLRAISPGRTSVVITSAMATACEPDRVPTTCTRITTIAVPTASTSARSDRAQRHEQHEEFEADDGDPEPRAPQERATPVTARSRGRRPAAARRRTA